MSRACPLTNRGEPTAIAVRGAPGRPLAPPARGVAHASAVSRKVARLFAAPVVGWHGPAQRGHVLGGPAHARASGLGTPPDAVVIAVCLLSVFAFVPAASFGEQVSLIRIDGATLRGQWMGMTGGTTLRVNTSKGMETVPLDGVSRLTFAHDEQPIHDGPQTDQAPAVESDGVSAVFHLADGGRLPGRLLGASETSDALLSMTILGEAVPLAFETLAGVELGDRVAFPRAGEHFHSSLAARLPGEDVLITRDTDDVKTLRGRLESLDADRGWFVFGGRRRSLSTDKAYGVVMAVGAGGPSDPKHQVRVSLIDGSVFSGRIVRADAGTIVLDSSVDVSVSLPVEVVSDIRVFSDRVVYLSAMTPVRRKVEGLLHEPWPVRFDKNVAGGPLTLGGRVYDHGVGTHSRTEIDYNLGRAFEKFASTIGIDDAVRPRGSVAFRVLGDASVLFESGTTTGMDAPREIVVDVSGVNVLTLIVEYADRLDLSDHADWADARVLKPSIERRAGGP